MCLVMAFLFSLIHNVNPQAGTQAYTAINVQGLGIKKLLQIMKAPSDLSMNIGVRVKSKLFGMRTQPYK